MERWFALGISSTLFVGGTVCLRLAREHGSAVHALATAMCLIIANIVYSRALAQDFMAGSIMSMMLCLVGYALAARIVFGEPVTLIKCTGLGLAVVAATLVAWPSTDNPSGLSSIPS